MQFIFDFVYKFWCFLCLYYIGFVYLFVEFNRRFQIFYKVRKLNLDKDLDVNLSNYVAIITGGNRGIGFYSAKHLLKKGIHVIITTCIKPGPQFDETYKLLTKSFSNLKGTFQLWHLELGSLDSTVAFIEKFNLSGLELNILINNAGVMFVPFKLTQDNFESHFQINYLSHCLLIWGLLPILNETGRKSRQMSRILNISSSTHYVRKLNLDDLQGLKVYSRYHAYSQSKLAQIMFTFKLHSYLTSKAINSNYDWVTVNCLHPGVVLTRLYENVLWVQSFPKLAYYLFRSGDEGAETVVFSAISPELDGVGGKYLEDCQILKSSSYSYNKEHQHHLWIKTFNYLQPWIEKLKLEMPLDSNNF